MEPTKQNKTLQLATKKRRRSTKDDEDRPGRKRKASKLAVDELEIEKTVKKVPLRRTSTASSKASSKSGGRRTPKVTLPGIGEEQARARKVSDGDNQIQSGLKTPVSAETGSARFAQYQKTLESLVGRPEVGREPSRPVESYPSATLPKPIFEQHRGSSHFAPMLSSSAASPLPGVSQDVLRGLERGTFGELGGVCPTPGSYPDFGVQPMNGNPTQRGQQTSALEVPRSPYHNEGQGLKRKADSGDDTAFLTPSRKRRHTDNGRNETSPVDHLHNGSFGAIRTPTPSRPASSGSSPLSNPGVTPRRAGSSKSGTSGAMGPPDSPNLHTTPKRKPMTGKGRPSNFDPNPMQTDVAEQDRVASSYNTYRPTRLNFSPQGRPSNFSPSPNASPTRPHDSPVGQPPSLAKPGKQYSELPRFRSSNFPKSGQQDNPSASGDAPSKDPTKPGVSTEIADVVEGTS